MFVLKKQRDELVNKIEDNIKKLEFYETKLETMNESEKTALLKYLIPETLTLYKNYHKMFKKVKL